MSKNSNNNFKNNPNNSLNSMSSINSSHNSSIDHETKPLSPLHNTSLLLSKLQSEHSNETQTPHNINMEITSEPILSSPSITIQENDHIQIQSQSENEIINLKNEIARRDDMIEHLKTSLQTCADTMKNTMTELANKDLFIEELKNNNQKVENGDVKSIPSSDTNNQSMNSPQKNISTCIHSEIISSKTNSDYIQKSPNKKRKPSSSPSFNDQNVENNLLFPSDNTTNTNDQFFKRASFFFDTFDQNKSGYIDKSQLLSLTSAINSQLKGWRSILFLKPNQNGLVNKNDFLMWIISEHEKIKLEQATNYSYEEIRSFKNLQFILS